MVNSVTYSVKNSLKRELPQPNLSQCSDRSRVEVDSTVPVSFSLMSVSAVGGVTRVL